MASRSGAIRAGRAFVEIFTDTKALKSGLAASAGMVKSFGANVSAIGTKISGIGRQFAVFGAAGVGALALTLKSASNLEEVLNKFRVVFGTNSDAMKAWSDDFASRMGRSKQQVADFLASMQTLVLPMGFDPKDAEEFSKTMAGLAFDLASFHNTSDADAFAALTSGIVGEAEPLKRYGVLLSETALKQELLTKGSDIGKASNYEKAMGRLAIIMRSTATAQGDVARSAGSVANQTKAAMASVDNMSASIGSALLPAVAKMLGYLSPIIEGFSRWIGQNPEMVTALAGGAVGVTALGLALSALGPLVAAAGTAIGLLATPIGLAGAALAALGGTFGLFKVDVQGALTDTVSGAKELFGELVNDAQGAMAGMREAINKGDWAGAMDILGDTLEMGMIRIITRLEQVWMKFWDDIALWEHNKLLNNPVGNLIAKTGIIKTHAQNVQMLAHERKWAENSRLDEIDAIAKRRQGRIDAITNRTTPLADLAGGVMGNLRAAARAIGAKAGGDFGPQYPEDPVFGANASGMHGPEFRPELLAAGIRSAAALVSGQFGGQLAGQALGGGNGLEKQSLTALQHIDRTLVRIDKKKGLRLQ